MHQKEPASRTRTPCRLGLGVIASAALLLAGCTETRLELDRMEGTAFPETIEHNGEDINLPRIYADQGDQLVIVDEDQTDIQPLADVVCLTAAEVTTLVIQNRQSASGEDQYPCYGFTCTRHNVYGLIADHLQCLAANVPDQDTAGHLWADDPHDIFLVYFAHSSIHNSATSHSKPTLLRAALHELGHTFNLHHEDHSGNSIMSTGGASTNYQFTNRSRDHLREHPDGNKYPSTGPFGNVIAAHTADHGAPLTVGPAETSLVLSLDVERRRVSLGEPLRVTVALTNRGDGPETIFADLRPSAGAVRIEITDPSGETAPFRPLLHSLVIADRPTLAPDESAVEELPIFFGGGGWTFDKPGAYRVRAVYSDPEKAMPSLESQSQEIVVEEGNGAGRLLIAAGTASGEAGRFLLWEGGDHLRAGIALLKELIAEYPESVVAHHARLALGASLSYDFQDYTLGRIRRAECEHALLYLDGLDREALSRSARIRGDLRRASCYQRLGRAEAGPVLDEARRLVEGAPALERFLDQQIAADETLRAPVSW